MIGQPSTTVQQDLILSPTDLIESLAQTARVLGRRHHSPKREAKSSRFRETQETSPRAKHLVRETAAVEEKEAPAHKENRDDPFAKKSIDNMWELFVWSHEYKEEEKKISRRKKTKSHATNEPSGHKKSSSRRSHEKKRAGGEKKKHHHKSSNNDLSCSSWAETVVVSHGLPKRKSFQQQLTASSA